MSEWPTEEEDLREPVCAFFDVRGYTVRDEVWINGRIADLYAYREDGEPIAVELKLSDWKKALGQAEAYQLGALYTYIALPVIHAPTIMRRATALRSRNVGLLGIAPGAGDGFQPASKQPDPQPGEPDVRELVEPGESERFLPFLADKIVEDAERPKRRETHVPRWRP